MTRIEISTVWLVTVLLTSGSAAAAERYTGCKGFQASEIVAIPDVSPAQACKSTIRRNLCQITPETCCFRQCYYFYTGEQSDRDALGESEMVRTKVFENIARIIDFSRDGGTRTSADLPVTLLYYDHCVASCASAVGQSSREIQRVIEPMD